MTDDDQPNHLLHYRKRRGLTQLEVARLLGWKNIKAISKMESGKAQPSVTTALKLSAVYRVPVEFLYRDLYLQLRSEIREKETASLGQQQPLQKMLARPNEPPPAHFRPWKFTSAIHLIPANILANLTI
jgi:transcriptional regulator with XRE-family HTH domain